MYGQHKLSHSDLDHVVYVTSMVAESNILHEEVKGQPNMNIHRSRYAVSLMLSIALPFGALEYAVAQNYPNRLVRIVDVFSPGGSTDFVGRVLASKLSPSVGQQVIVENRPGAGGRIGTESIAKSPPDGYTLLIGLSTTLAASAGLYPKLPYDVVRDLAPISRVATVAYIAVSHPSLPVKSVKELIALAKARPGQLNYASGGSGSGGHLFAELLKSRAGVDIVHVAYNGILLAITSVISGEVGMAFLTITTAVDQIKAGRLRALGITSPRRSAIVPGVPTISEAGLPGFEIVTTFGVFAPAGTPPEIVGRLNAELQKVIAQSDVRERFAALGMEASASSPEELGSLLRNERVLWIKVIKDAGIRVE